MMKIPTITLLMSASIVALFAIFGATPESLIWLSSIEKLEPWRWLSAHFVHISAEHLIWNLLPFIILGSIIEQHSKRDLLLGLGLGIVCINGYLAWFFVLPAYAGLSGVLNTLLVVALTHLYRHPDYRWAAMTVLVASLAKIIYELYFEASLFSSLDWPAVPEAHLVGWLAGSLLFFRCCRKTSQIYPLSNKVSLL